MSILQEYEEYRKRVGNEEWQMMNKFLEENRQYLLSDLLYRKSIYAVYQQWKKGR